MEEGIVAHRVLVGKHEVKRPLGKRRLRKEGNIKMGLQEVEWEDVDWIDLAEDRDTCQALVNAVMNIWLP
jgi:hypothetical protein